MLPVILAEFTVGEDALWLVNSSLMIAFVSYRLVRSFRGQDRSSNRLAWSGDWTLFVLMAAQFALQAVNILGFPIERGPGPYVAGVALFLGSAGQAFFRLLALPEEAAGSE